MRAFRRVAISLAVILVLGWSAQQLWTRLTERRLAETPVIPSRVSQLPTQNPLETEAADTDPFVGSRRDMVRFQLESRGVEDKDVLRAMETVPRHEFVTAEYLNQAYEDHPLPIGFGQTISQPYIVAVMTELLQLRYGARVLEIGTGSGYQAAILAELVSEVYSVEIVPELCERAAKRLASLHYDNVHVRCADGYDGWEEHGPYDAIIVTCAPDHIPQSLVGQLADGGRLVIPVGPPGAYQVLWLVTRVGEEIKSQRTMGVSFVPLTGGHWTGESGR